MNKDNRTTNAVIRVAIKHRIHESMVVDGANWREVFLRTLGLQTCEQWRKTSGIGEKSMRYLFEWCATDSFIDCKGGATFSCGCPGRCGLIQTVRPSRRRFVERDRTIAEYRDEGASFEDLAIEFKLKKSWVIGIVKNERARVRHDEEKARKEKSDGHCTRAVNGLRNLAMKRGWAHLEAMVDGDFLAMALPLVTCGDLRDAPNLGEHSIRWLKYQCMELSTNIHRIKLRCGCPGVCDDWRRSSTLLRTLMQPGCS